MEFLLGGMKTKKHSHSLLYLVNSFIRCMYSELQLRYDILIQNAKKKTETKQKFNYISM